MVTSGAITNRIDRLAAKGLVERLPDEEDRRSIRVRLTAQGLAKIDELVGPHVENEARLLAELGPRERDQLAACCAACSSRSVTPPRSRAAARTGGWTARPA
ncbi:MarR family winged helix-turn-helix transcriptional regulator [Nonomuraea thailandensis]